MASYKGLPDFSEMMGKKGVSRKQGKGRHSQHRTGGPGFVRSEELYGGLAKNLKSYATASKLQQIYAAHIFLQGEEDFSEFWELVEFLRKAGALEHRQSNQWIWDNWLGDPQSYNQIQRMVEGMEDGTGQEVIAMETRSLRGGQTVITGHKLSPENEAKRLEALAFMLERGDISQEVYEERVGKLTGAGTSTREYPRNVKRQRFPDDPRREGEVWGQ